MSKRFVVFLVVMGLVLGAAVAPVSATPGGGSADLSVSLERAVGIAKSFNAVPAGFTEFSSNFSSFEDSPRWYLSWRSPKEGPGWGEMSVTVDAKTGEVLSMWLWVDDRTPRPRLPKFSRTEAERAAREFAAARQPKFNETRLSIRADVPDLPDEYRHSFYFERLVNGIPFPENGIRVVVDSNTLKVMQYEFRWEDLSFPKPDNLIGLEDARGKLLEKAAPRLVYFRPYPEGDEVRPVILVYQTERTSRYGVDAATGDLIDFGLYFGGPGGAGDSQMRSPAKKELSPAEEKEVKEVQGVLPQDEAKSRAESYVEIPDDYVLQNAGLYRDSEYPERRQWRFEWSTKEDPGKARKKGGSVSVSLEAKSGELLSFRIYEWDQEAYGKEPEVRFSEDQARAIAEGYLKRLQPERFSSCKLGEPERPRPLGDEKPREYSFKFERYVDGVPFPQQGFTVEVNSTTGKVTSYNMAWTDLEFPKAEGIISQEQASQLYFKANEFFLCYARPLDPRFDGAPYRKATVKLVYRTLSQKPAWEREQMIDAKSGRFVDWRGNPIPEKSQGFDDIAAHPARDAIEILADRMIVLGMPDGKYHPDEPVLQSSFLAMLMRSKGFRPDAASGDKWYLDYERQARIDGILKEGESLSPYSPITRETAAVWTVRALGQDGVASLQGIWKVPASDVGDIRAPGHVTLYLAQGLDPDRQGSVRPGKTMTRGQAAQAMVLFLRWVPNGQQDSCVGSA